MTDQPETSAPEESFAQLLEAFSPGTRSEVRVRDRVKGKVISIRKDTIFVDAGMKIDAVVDRSELLAARQQVTCAEGDELELYVTAVGENEIRLSRALSGIGGAKILREAQQKSAPVEGKVKEIVECAELVPGCIYRAPDALVGPITCFRWTGCPQVPFAEKKLPTPGKL